jgi:hypothetical protein
VKRLPLIFVIASLVAGCRAVAGDVHVDVWNLSPAAITLVTEEPGPFLFPNTETHVIEPWKKGRCFAHLGLFEGRIKMTVSGSNVAAPITFETAGTSSTEVGIQIDPSGKVEFGGTFPDDVVPCEGGGY